LMCFSSACKLNKLFSWINHWCLCVL